MRLRAAVLLIALLPPPVPAAEEAPASTLYVATLIQAAPGRLLELLELEKAFRAGAAERGDEAPWLLRHSQGDKWDLMRLQPIGSFSEYFAEKRAAQRERWRQKSAADLDAGARGDRLAGGRLRSGTRARGGAGATLAGSASSTSRCSWPFPGAGRTSSASARWRTRTRRRSTVRRT